MSPRPYPLAYSEAWLRTSPGSFRLLPDSPWPHWHPRASSLLGIQVVDTTTLGWVAYMGIIGAGHRIIKGTHMDRVSSDPAQPKAPVQIEIPTGEVPAPAEVSTLRTALKMLGCQDRHLTLAVMGHCTWTGCPPPPPPRVCLIPHTRQGACPWEWSWEWEGRGIRLVEFGGVCRCMRGELMWTCLVWAERSMPDNLIHRFDGQFWRYMYISVVRAYRLSNSASTGWSQGNHWVDNGSYHLPNKQKANNCRKSNPGLKSRQHILSHTGNQFCIIRAHHWPQASFTFLF